MKKDSTFLDKFKGKTENIGKDGFQGLFSTNQTISTVKKQENSFIKKNSRETKNAINVNNSKVKDPIKINTQVGNKISMETRKKESNVTAQNVTQSNIREKAIKQNVTKKFKNNSLTSNPIKNKNIENQERLHSSPLGSVFPNPNFPVINGLSNIAMTNYNYNAFNPFGFFQTPTSIPNSMMQVYPHNYYPNNVQSNAYNNNEFVNMYNPNNQMYFPMLNKNNTNQLFQQEPQQKPLLKREQDKQRIRVQSANKTIDSINLNNNLNKNFNPSPQNYYNMHMPYQQMQQMQPIPYQQMQHIQIQQNNSEIQLETEEKLNSTCDKRDSTIESRSLSVNTKPFKPYTIDEYKEISDNFKSLNRGGLGANIGSDEWLKKYEKNQKIIEYAKDIKQKHQNLKLDYKDPSYERQKVLRQKMEESGRNKAILYCKTKLPKLNHQNTSNMTNTENSKITENKENLNKKPSFSFKEEEKSEKKFSMNDVFNISNNKNYEDIKSLLQRHNLPDESIQNIRSNQLDSNLIKPMKGYTISTDLNNLDISNVIPSKEVNRKESENDTDHVNYELSNINPSPILENKRESKISNLNLNKWDLLDNNDEYQVDNELLNLQKKRLELADKIEKIKESLI